MKEGFVNGMGAVVAHDQPTKIAEPCEGPFHLPTSPVAAQCSAILGARLAAIPAMGRDQFDSSFRQPLAQRIAVVGAVGNDALRFLPWPSAAMPPGHADRCERFFCEPDLVG